jgi:hypothetical protein
MRRPALIAVLCLLSAAAVPAAHAAGWTPPIAGAPQVDMFDKAQVAIDGAGDTWIAYTPNSSRSLYLVERPAGGAFGAPVQLADIGELPRIAVDSAGDVVIAWTTVVSAQSYIAAATISAGGAVQKLGIVSAVNTTAVTVACNPAGAAVIAWATTPGVFKAMTRQGPGQAFGSPVTLGTTYQDGSSASGSAVATPVAAVDGYGHVTIAYAQSESSYSQIFAITNSNGSWAGVPVRLTTATDNNAQPAIAADGANTVVAWEDTSGAANNEIFATIGTSTAVFPPTFGTLQQLSDGSNSAQPPSAAIDAAGDAIVAWPEIGSGTGPVRASLRQPGGPFSPASAELHVADEYGVVPDIPVVMLPSGTAVVGWQAEPFGAFTDKTEARTVSATSPPGQVAQLDPSSNSGNLSLVGAPALDSAGEPVFAWEPSGGGVDISAYDSAPPTLAVPSVPGAAIAGVAAPMSVATPFDVWSGPAGVTWSFGDGASASGLSVAHAYAAPGVYTVTVTATDALGNASSQSAQITVKQPFVSPTVLVCKVPSLTHLTAAQAKSHLTAAHCSLGKQTKRRKPRSTRGLKYGVVAQSLKTSTTHPGGTKVNVTLGWYKPPKPKRRK